MQHQKPAGLKAIKRWLSHSPRQTRATETLTRAASLATLARELQRALPPALAGHWQAARLDADALVLVAEGPAFATQLRYATPLLLDAVARHSGIRPRNVEIKSTAYQPVRRERHRVTRNMSEENADLLKGMASGVDDPRLSQALRRLASAGDRNSGSK